MYKKMFAGKLIKILIVSFVLMFTFCSCGQQSKKSVPEQQSTQDKQQEEKVPDQLKKMEESIEKIFKELEGPAVAVKEEGPKQGGQKGNASQENPGQESKKQEGGKEEEGEKKEEGSQKQDNKQNNQPSPPAPTPSPDPWQKVNTLVNELHYQWNEYTPMALKNNASRTLLDNYGSALNNLTNTVNSKNKMNVMLAANNVYSYMPEFYYLYKTKNSPEVKKIRHYARSSILYGTNGNWSQSDSDVNNLKSSWAVYKNTLPKEQQEAASKLEFAIYEYEKVVKEKNQQLVDIKGKIVLSNVESLEKAMEEQEKQKGS